MGTGTGLRLRGRCSAPAGPAARRKAVWPRGSDRGPAYSPPSHGGQVAPGTCPSRMLGSSLSHLAVLRHTGCCQ